VHDQRDALDLGAEDRRVLERYHTDAFERRALQEVSLDIDTIPPRYRSSYFDPIFAGGYSSGYYSNIWSEVLDADTVEWFIESGGLVREAGDTFRTVLLSRGGTAPEMSYFKAFRGREPRIKPLLERRGLALE
jgi:peptidyl-dipeptidase Dcp